MACDFDYSWRLIQAPAAEPMTLDQAKDHLRIERDLTDFDPIISRYVASARGLLEDRYGIRIVKQKWELLLVEFPDDSDRIKIPVWPVQSVDYFHYRDQADNPYTFAASTGYRTRLYRKPSEIVLPTSGVWPSVVLDNADGIQIGLTLGWQKDDSPESMPRPAAIDEAMMMLVGHMYDNGSAVTVDERPSLSVHLGLDSFMENVRLHFN